MKQIPTKVDNVGDTFNAAEINSTTFELQNAVLDSGQPLSEGDLFQTSKAMAVYASAGDFYIDTGTATAYQLGVIGAKKYPPNYIEGQRIRFIATNTNTATATARIDTLPVKDIKDGNGNDLIEGEILTGKQIELIYNGTYFILSDNGISGSEFLTGDVKATVRPTAPPGWIIMNDGTIGDALSGGTTRANADAEELFSLLWGQVPDTWCPVSGGRGASSAADFAAHKTLTLFKTLGRAIACAGSGAGFTPRVAGENLGEEAHQQSVAELAAHIHSFDYRDNADWNAVKLGGQSFTTGAKYYNTQSTGSSTPFNIMQPTFFLNFFIKL